MTQATGISTDPVPNDVKPGEAPKQEDKTLPANTPEDQTKEPAKPADTPDPKPEDKTAPKPDDKVEDNKDDKKDAPLDKETWGSTGDEVGDSVLELIQNSGMTTEEAKTFFAEATMSLDPSKIDRDALVAKVGKSTATLILAGVENFTAKEKDRINSINSTLHTAAGGKAEWDTITDWAKNNLDESVRREYGDLINQGGKKAAFVVHDLKQQYAAAGNSDTADTTVVPDANPASKAGTIEPLSSGQYYEKLNALKRSGKSTPAQEDALWKARVAGKNKGI